MGCAGCVCVFVYRHNLDGGGVPIAAASSSASSSATMAAHAQLAATPAPPWPEFWATILSPEASVTPTLNPSFRVGRSRPQLSDTSGSDGSAWKRRANVTELGQGGHAEGAGRTCASASECTGMMVGSHGSAREERTGDINVSTRRQVAGCSKNVRFRKARGRSGSRRGCCARWRTGPSRSPRQGGATLRCRARHSESGTWNQGRG